MKDIINKFGFAIKRILPRAFVEFVSENNLKPYIHYPDWWVVKNGW